jgi:hypothetical protein
MKKLLFASIAVAAVVGVAGAGAAITTNISSPFSLTVFVPCANGGAGENVDLSGDLHTLITFTINGNHVSGNAHFQPQGVSGTGATTGDKYRATGVTKDNSFSVSFTNGRAQQTFVNNFRIIGPGPGNNLLVDETAHLTFNANGTVSAFHDNLSVECK